jgi:8-oxo-dGTP pyrophosphatase MutT (NUDIX family)
MKKEYSYGAVVFSREGLALIEHMALGHYALPKGHIEKGESEEACALREIKEETGLEVDLDTSFREEETYTPYPGISKTVTYFLGFLKGGVKKPQESEVKEILFLNEEDGKKILTFPSDQAILVKAFKAYQQKKESGR